MQLLYIKTSEISLEVFLKFCYNKLTNKKNWKKFLEKSYIISYQNSEYILFTSKGKYIGCLEQLKEIIRSGQYIWTINNIDYIEAYEEEYFDFYEYENLIDIEKYKISKISFNRKKEWIYIEVENKYSHYRSFMINLNSFINLKKYLRLEKINNLLNNI